jgi:cytochrome c-type biogenesis protein CcmH/NrfF
MDNLWFVAVAIGPVLLGGAMIYAMMRRRRLSRAEETEQDQAVRELYDKPTPRPTTSGTNTGA